VVISSLSFAEKFFFQALAVIIAEALALALL
jgi:hypothetical protein